MAPNPDLFYPSLSINPDGRIGMVFGMSNQFIYPTGLFATFNQSFLDVDSEIIMQGNANTNVFNKDIRFGDYFSAVTDPLDIFFWISGEYGDNNTGFPNATETNPYGWSTFIANVPIPSSGK